MSEQTEVAPDEAARRAQFDFHLFWVGSVVSVLGSRLSGIAYPLLVLALNGTAAEAGLVGFAGTLPLFLLQLPAGALVDRWDRKRVMVVSDLVRGLVVATVPVALFFDIFSIPHLMAVSFIQGALSIFYKLCEAGAVRTLVPPARLGSALGQVEARERGAGLVGQPLGGFLFGLSFVAPFLVDAISYAVNLVALLFIRTKLQKERPPPKHRNLGEEILTGLVWVWRQPFIRAAALLIAGSNMLFRMLFLMVIVLAKAQGASAATIGLILTGSGIGGLLGSLAAPWCQRHLPKKAVVIGVNWVWALLMPLMAVTSNLYVLGALLGVMTFVGPIWNVTLSVYQLSLIPDELLGRVQSASQLVAMGTIPLGSLLAGYMLDFVGGQTTAMAIGAFMVLVAVAATISPAIREMTDAPEEPAVGLAK